MSNLANLSCMAREDLVKEIETLIDQLQRKEIDVAGLRSENEQFLSMVERTNTALLELKVRLRAFAASLHSELTKRHLGSHRQTSTCPSTATKP